MHFFDVSKLKSLKIKFVASFTIRKMRILELWFNVHVYVITTHARVGSRLASQALGHVCTASYAILSMCALHGCATDVEFR